MLLKHQLRRDALTRLPLKGRIAGSKDLFHAGEAAGFRWIEASALRESESMQLRAYLRVHDCCYARDHRSTLADGLLDGLLVPAGFVLRRACLPHAVWNQVAFVN